MPPTPVQKPSKDYVKIIGPAVLITLLGFAAAYQFVDPAPPSRITLATGGRDGAYHLFGLRYREILARSGVDLVLRPSAGSVENLGLLEAPGGEVDLAFVQGGTGRGGGDLEALGSLYFEPLWVFHRVGLPAGDPRDLRGLRLAVGAEGSGTRAVALALLADNGMSSSEATMVPLGGGEAARALLAGDVDAVFFVASPQSPAVRGLLVDDTVALMSFERAAAYARTHRFLSTVTLPRGIINLETDVPPRDVTLLAPAAGLVARSSLHPALVGLLLEAATEVHGEGGLFEDREQFPSPHYLEYPLNVRAKRYFKSGPPLLQRYLPFWAATLIDRLLVMLLPLLALALPLVRLMPPLFRWRIRSRIYRWYRELLAMDPALLEGADTTRLEECRAALERLEAEVSRVEVPLSYADQLYHLRLHIDLVRDKLEKAGAAK